MGKLRYNFRMWLIHKLYDYAISCWCELVMWAYGPPFDPFLDLFDILKRLPQGCIDDAATSIGTCYCGKYRNKGKPGWSEIAIEQARKRAA